MDDTHARFRRLLLAAHPDRAARLARGSKAAGIELFCLECTGDTSGAAEAAACSDTTCPLWALGFGRGTH